ncbi:MAG: MFS transporter [Nitrososphaerales archaeon]
MLPPYSDPAAPAAGSQPLEQATIRVYGYRWATLLAFMLAIAANQVLWITFAPITGEAAKYYGVSDLSIGLLSLIFMLVYIVVAIPASWAIDRFGIRKAVGFGAVLTGGFGLLRGLASQNYTLVLVAQIGIAIGQPFILNAITTVAARWFPLNERATASGLGWLATYFGILAALVLTPYLMLRSGIGSLLMIYGIFAALAAVAFFAIARERPPTPPCPPGQAERSLMYDGLRQALRQRDFIVLLVIFFVGLGVFNSVTTWIEDIVRPRGFTVTEAGNAGGLMILGGIIGALILPTLSDHYHRRTPFLVLALLGAIAALCGLIFAASYALLLASAAGLGFFLLSAGPIGFQYGAEVTYPAPEGTSNGLLLLIGQVSGIAFILALDAFKSPQTGSMTAPLLALVGLMIVSLVLCTRLREAPALRTGG